MHRKPRYSYSHGVPASREVIFPFQACQEPLITQMVYVEDDHVQQIFSLCQTAADLGLNTGTDEYSSLDDLVNILDLGPAFVFLKDDDEKSVIDGALLMPGFTSQRSWRPHTCEIKIILSERLHQVAGFERLLQLVHELLDEMPELLYDSLVVSIFAPNYDYMKAARKLKFNPCLIVPGAGYVKGLTLPQDSLLFYKDIKDDVPLRTLDQMREMLDRLEEENKQFEVTEESLRFPFLPVHHVFRNGKELVLRDIGAGEDEKIYQCVMKYADRGEGYTFDDFPSLYAMRGYFLRNHYVAVIEDVVTKDTVGYLIMGDSENSRTTREKHMADTSLIMEQKYQGAGFGGELMEIGLGIMKDVGYRSTLSDLLVSNLPMFNLTTKLGYSKVGFNPKSCYMEGEGWIDGLYTYNDLSKRKSFLKDMHNPPPPNVE